ncbi:hypothetical protein FHR98_001788 [Limibacillus halophilus]|uniref:Uncharacterized protein n=1 Tax=Limibacillus halophilus TaxID=1579333 RepID=A0A839SRT7_9PROT|nr:hypothetical protein [Limibacillus halophilus]
MRILGAGSQNNMAYWYKRPEDAGAAAVLLRVFLEYQE